MVKRSELSASFIIMFSDNTLFSEDSFCSGRCYIKWYSRKGKETIKKFSNPVVEKSWSELTEEWRRPPVGFTLLHRKCLYYLKLKLLIGLMTSGKCLDFLISPSLCICYHFYNPCDSRVSRGQREVPGQSTRSKNFKTPFFWRYLKFLLWRYSNRSRTSPNFFFLRYLNKYSC